MSEPALTVYAFSPAWGLPSSGPFAIKLIAWLRLAGLPHEVRYENDTRKGPKGKNPWIELDGELMGDTELIVEHLGERFGASLDEGLSAEQVGRGLCIRRMVEEHLHQVFEHELIVQDAGYQSFKRIIARAAPGFLVPIIGWWLRSHFRKQLKARGVGRHSLDDIARAGRADIDALEALLGDRAWFVADRPTLTDCSVYGLLAPFVKSDFDTAVCSYARSRRRLVEWVDQMGERLDSDPEARRATDPAQRVAG